MPPASDPQAGLSEEEARRADLIWAGGVTLAMLLVFLVLMASKGAAVPVLVSVALAYALDPLIDQAEARGVSRTVAILILFVLVTLGFAGFMLYLVPAFGAEVGKLPQFFQGVGERLLPRIEALAGGSLPAKLHELAGTLGKPGGAAEKALPGVASFLMSALGGTASLLLTTVGLMLIPVLTFYLLRDYDKLVAWLRALLPRRYEPLIASRFAEVDGVLSSFIRGQLTVGAILTALYAVGLTLAGIDLSVVIGAVAGFGTMIPYLGPACGAGLALLSLLVSWQGLWQLLAVGAIFTVVMSLEGLYLTPRIVGGKVGLSAVAVIIAILVFGELFGFVGVLLAVPVTAALKVVVRVVLLRYQRSRLYRGVP